MEHFFIKKNIKSVNQIRTNNKYFFGSHCRTAGNYETRSFETIESIFATRFQWTTIKEPCMKRIFLIHRYQSLKPYLSCFSFTHAQLYLVQIMSSKNIRPNKI